MKTNPLLYLFIIINTLSYAQDSTSNVTNLKKANHTIYWSPLHIIQKALHIDYEFRLNEKHGFLVGASNHHGSTTTDYSLDPRLRGEQDEVRGENFSFTYRHYFSNSNSQKKYYGLIKYNISQVRLRGPAYLSRRYYNNEFEAFLVAEYYASDALLQINKQQYSFGLGVLATSNDHFNLSFETNYTIKNIQLEGEAKNEKIYNRDGWDYGNSEYPFQIRFRMGLTL